jgi:hypothetical protein
MVFGLGFGALALVTAVWPTWIEVAFRVDPDNGDGLLEWSLVSAFAALALVIAAIHRRRVRVLRATA